MTRELRTTMRPGATRWVLGIAMVCVGWAGSVSAQDIVIRQDVVPPPRIIPGRRAILIDDLDPFGARPVQGNDSGGATLKTDPDLEQFLESAERLRADGNYRAASKFWQAVLTRSGDAMYSEDDRYYYSLSRRVEKILAALPPEGLQAYRVVADAEAREILAAAPDPLDVAALSRVIREYFISSLGDQAALTLATLQLDRHDFVGAERLLKKIIEQHPDPDVSLAEVWLKKALCEMWTGDADAARESLAEARQRDAAGVGLLADAIEARIGHMAQDSTTVPAEPWSVPFGTSRRYGVMPTLPPEALSDELVAVWQYGFDPVGTYLWADFKKVRVLQGDSAHDATAERTVSQGENQLHEHWLKKGWQPTGQLLFHQGQVYFKTPVDLIAWNADALSDQFVWRPVWRNAFEIDDLTKLIIMYQNNGNLRQRMPNLVDSDAPFSAHEIQLFGDRIHAQMSVVDGVLYTIEGRPFNDRLRNRPAQQAMHWNAIARRSRTNHLTAYDASTGMVLWTLPRRAPESDSNETAMVADPDAEMADSPWLESGGFMGAPIGYQGLVIAPVNQGGAISVYAFDPGQEGKTVWKAFLCDEPATGASPWAPIHLSIDGSDLFVTTGLGVVFVLDPSTGMIRFARRYQRQGKDFELLRRFNNNLQQQTFEGWSSDMVIPWRQQMICLCSDTQTIEALDRSDGRLIWRSDINPLNFKVDYLLGIYNDVLYAAGSETLIGYDLRGEGRMVIGGEQMFDGDRSYGRGILTPQGIFLPVGNTIVQFALGSGSDQPGVIRTMHVDLGNDGPVGNLFSDGKRIWVHGANRLYVLGPDEANGTAENASQANDEEMP